MPAIGLIRLENATADGHFFVIAQGPIREPGQITPNEFLSERFVVREDLNVFAHENVA